MADYIWQKATEQAPYAGRDGAGAVTFNGRMWLLGGWNQGDPVHFPKQCNSEVWSSFDGRDWKLEVKGAPWEGRHCAGYVVHQDKMWIVGGDPNQGHYQDDVWNTADGMNWKQVCAKVPWGPRCLHYAMAFDNRIWVMGGQTIPQVAPAEEIFYTDVWNSSDGANWTKVGDSMPWGVRGFVEGKALFKGRMWILGGGTYDTPKRPERRLYNDVWSSADGIRWEKQMAEAPWSPRQFLNAAVFDGRLWVMGGWNQKEGDLNDVWYSEDGVRWTELPGTPWPTRHAASVFVHDQALWILAGSRMSRDVWKLTRAV